MKLAIAILPLMLCWSEAIAAAQASHPSDRSSNQAPISKITFNLSQISEAGLIGNPDGLRSLMYEFCIPATAQALAEVQAIDPGLTSARSPGRIRCQPDQYLIIGDTHKPNWRSILTQLTHLDTVKRIDQFFGE